MNLKKISVIDNVQYQYWKEVIDYITLSNFPSRNEVESRNWHNLGVFWSDFRPAANFSILRNSLQLKNPYMDMANYFLKMAEKYDYRFDIKKLLLMRCHTSVARHVDKPYRNETLNWYVFPTHNHKLVVEDVEYYPRQGDLVWINTSLPHSTIHSTSDEIYFMGL